MRQIVLDTETTGLTPREGHRIIEIGCVEMRDRRLTRNNFHCYLQPDRQIDAGAEAVHGISNAFLADQPRFGEVAERFLRYVEGAELIIHNAPFDLGFLDHELGLWRKDEDGAMIAELCTVTDTLVMARRLHPGQRNGLDALCKRYGVDNSRRALHGALLDAEILADVYLAMTGGQFALELGAEPIEAQTQGAHTNQRRSINPERAPLRIVRADETARSAHAARLTAIAAESANGCLWRQEEDR